MKLKSSAFKHESHIPIKYTCNGDDISPPLSWSELPEGTVSLVLICDDPDAPMGTWDHWILFNIPASVKGFEEDIKEFPKDVGFGKNSWKRNDYGGPCPPDREHRYFFNLYALDTTLKLKNGVTKEEVLEAMTDHILDETVLMGRYNQPGQH
ncbi:MAG: YbhB/YbcL family Raf kinase inhibitor-like protein [Verrucomicrobia bacterium]|nr:MAG: YbhB/YbcL family Raf kinase inhibitor-like protein [Verrucomicrobiota bacterium]